MALPAPPANVGDMLRKAQHILRLAMDDGLRILALTAPQYAALKAIAERPGISGAALAKRCFVTPQTITGILGNLESAGLIARGPDPDHGRILQTRLTPTGAELLMRAHRVVQEIEERMLRDLDRAEREALADLLAQCADALAQH
jgi:DNA-binding MarR family transcriptional regulator